MPSPLSSRCGSSPGAGHPPLPQGPLSKLGVYKSTEDEPIQAGVARHTRGVSRGPQDRRHAGAWSFPAQLYILGKHQAVIWFIVCRPQRSSLGHGHTKLFLASRKASQKRNRKVSLARRREENRLGGFPRAGEAISQTRPCLPRAKCSSSQAARYPPPVRFSLGTDGADSPSSGELQSRTSYNIGSLKPRWKNHLSFEFVS